MHGVHISLKCCICECEFIYGFHVHLLHKQTSFFISFIVYPVLDSCSTNLQHKAIFWSKFD